MFSVADLVTALGWFGAVAGAVAYLLVSRGRWNAASARYQSANLTGAGLMGGVAAFNGVWPSAAANLIWVVIGGQALWVISLKKRASRGRAVLEAPLAVAEAVDGLIATAPSVESSTLSVEPSTLSVEPSTLSVEPSTLSVEPGAPSVESSTLSVEPGIPSVELVETPADTWEERDPTLRMSKAELAELTGGRVAAAA